MTEEKDKWQEKQLDPIGSLVIDTKAGQRLDDTDRGFISQTELDTAGLPPGSEAGTPGLRIGFEPRTPMKMLETNEAV